MTAERIALIGTALAVGVLAGFWILNDERFGRPAGAPNRTVAAENTPADRPPRIEMHAERFMLCSGPVRVNCVVDGDTFWLKGDKIRIADIDAPEISAPHCEDEKIVGETARDRLLELLNVGGFSLQSGWRETDRYGRKLRTVTRSDRSLGEMVVAEGLARRWNAPRRDWCIRG